MESKEFISILKKDSEAYVSKDDKFIRIIVEYLRINNFCVIRPTYLHIVDNTFVSIDEKVRIDLTDIKEVVVL